MNTLNESGVPRMVAISNLITMLRSDVVEFQFEKKDGTIRTAYGTRNPKIISDTLGSLGRTSSSGKSGASRPGFVTYFDMEKKDFRSFAEDRFLGVIDEHSKLFENYSSENNILNFSMFTYINESINSYFDENDEE